MEDQKRLSEDQNQKDVKKFNEDYGLMVSLDSDEKNENKEALQKDYENRVYTEIMNFILWFWSDDEERKRPLKALNDYHKERNYNEVFYNG